MSRFAIIVTWLFMLSLFMIASYLHYHVTRTSGNCEYLMSQCDTLKTDVKELNSKVKELSDGQAFAAEVNLPIKVVKLYQDKGFYASVIINPRQFSKYGIPSKLNIRVQLPEEMEEWSVETIYGFTDEKPVKHQPVHIIDPREHKCNSWWYVDDLEKDKTCKLYIYVFACKEGGNCTCSDCECSCWASKHSGCRSIKLEKGMDYYATKAKSEMQVSLFWTR